MQISFPEWFKYVPIICTGLLGLYGLIPKWQKYPAFFGTLVFLMTIVSCYLINRDDAKNSEERAKLLAAIEHNRKLLDGDNGFPIVNIQVQSAAKIVFNLTTVSDVALKEVNAFIYDFDCAKSLAEKHNGFMPKDEYERNCNAENFNGNLTVAKGTNLISEPINRKEGTFYIQLTAHGKIFLERLIIIQNEGRPYYGLVITSAERKAYPLLYEFTPGIPSRLENEISIKLQSMDMMSLKGF